MGTFVYSSDGATCPITYPDNYNLSEENITSFKPFKTWITKIQKAIVQQTSNEKHVFHSNPYKLHSIQIQSADWFGPRIGFMKISAKIENQDGEFLPGAIFLRGASVAMLMILSPEDTTPSRKAEEEYVILTVQPRLASGSFAFVELPAGMLDNSGTFAGAAAKEIEEECGLTVREDELINMSELAAATSQVEDAQKESEAQDGLPVGVFPSVGACDEFIQIFLCRKTIKRSELDAWQGKLTGLREEGEKITLKLVKLKDLWKECHRDAKALSALALYNGLREGGII